MKGQCKIQVDGPQNTHPFACLISCLFVLHINSLRLDWCAAAFVVCVMQGVHHTWRTWTGNDEGSWRLECTLMAMGRPWSWRCMVITSIVHWMSSWVVCACVYDYSLCHPAGSQQNGRDFKHVWALKLNQNLGWLKCYLVGLQLTQASWLHKPCCMRKGIRYRIIQDFLSYTPDMWVTVESTRQLQCQTLDSFANSEFGASLRKICRHLQLEPSVDGTWEAMCSQLKSAAHCSCPTLYYNAAARVV